LKTDCPGSHLACVLDLLDEVAASTLWARKEPLPLVLVRQQDDLPKQVPFVRFLKGQEAVT